MVIFLQSVVTLYAFTLLELFQITISLVLGHVVRRVDDNQVGFN